MTLQPSNSITRAALSWSAVIDSGLQSAIKLIPDHMERFSGTFGTSIGGVVLADRLARARIFLDELDVLLAGEVEWSVFCEGVRALICCAMFIVEQEEAFLNSPSSGDSTGEFMESMDLVNKYRHVIELLFRTYSFSRIPHGQKAPVQIENEN